MHLVIQVTWGLAAAEGLEFDARYKTPSSSPSRSHSTLSQDRRPPHPPIDSVGVIDVESRTRCPFPRTSGVG